MLTRTRTFTGLAAAAAVLALTGCGGDGYNQYTAPGTIVHLEYIPASTVTVNECSGAVPVMCADRAVLQKQCWRVDVHRKWTDFVGDPQELVTPTCVFPSEFKAMKVGDAWTEPAVTY